jgi:hypothetical protein
VDESAVTVHRERRVGFRGLVAEVRIGDRVAGLVYLSGTTPPGETTELWKADAMDGADLFLTEHEAIQRTVIEDRRNGGTSGTPPGQRGRR